MPRILITGSSDGLGLLAAQELARDGHQVVLHARNDGRAADARAALPGATAVVVGDLSSLDGMRQVATQANTAGPFDAVIHNAAVGYRDRRRIVTPDGFSHVFATNVLAPYLLTALVTMPRRLIYLSSGLHRSGNPSLDDLQWEHRGWDGLQAYTDSKLFDAVLAFAVARHRPDVLSNALEPGWVATKMGGPDAPDDLALGAATQVWLAASDEPEARVSGRYFYHWRPRETASCASSRCARGAKRCTRRGRRGERPGGSAAFPASRQMREASPGFGSPPFTRTGPPSEKTESEGPGAFPPMEVTRDGPAIPRYDNRNQTGDPAEPRSRSTRLGGHMMCALAGFTSHVNLILSGPPDTFADPDGRLEGGAKTGRHLKLRSLDELPRAAVLGWLRAAAKLARKQK